MWKDIKMTKTDGEVAGNKQKKKWYDLSFLGGDYEECRLLGYKNPVRTSQETH
jgi:hypothetical protein